MMSNTNVLRHGTLFWLTVILSVNNIFANFNDEERQLRQFGSSTEQFAFDIYEELGKARPNENIVFSPLSIQTCMAMVRIGAEGKTAEELNRGLHLVSTNMTIMAEAFKTLLAKYADSNFVKMANRIYVRRGSHIQENFQQIINEKFLSGAEEIDFGSNTEAATKINDWVKLKTNNLITDLIPASALNSDTRLVLLNAIHFKGQWRYKFPKENTRDDDFYLNESDKIKVPMMGVNATFRYGDLHEMDASVLELPYTNTDLSMWIFLPNSRTGLKGLIEHLRHTSFDRIDNEMYSVSVNVKLPKFTAKFSIELCEPMKKLGMARMFSDDAEFGKMLQPNEPLKVSNIFHKAYLEVNEDGTKAAAATGSVIMMKSLMPQEDNITFEANRPFFYVILNREKVGIFAGNTLQLQ